MKAERFSDDPEPGAAQPVFVEELCVIGRRLARLAFVALSRGSTPARAFKRIAASVTVRAIGPAVSWLWAIGIIPARLIKPSVGLIPTSELSEDGQTTEPSVSVPMAAAQRLAAAAAPEPELEPHGLRLST